MKTIEQKNKLIAEFMGYEAYEHTNSVAIRLKEGNEFNSLDIGHIHAKFHTSWDWLMPVVAKITRDEEFIDNDFRESVLDVVGFAHIDDTYSVVVKFIEWYNENK